MEKYKKIGPAHKILPQIKSDICCKFRDVVQGGDEDAECDRIKKLLTQLLICTMYHREPIVYVRTVVGFQ